MAFRRNAERIAWATAGLAAAVLVATWFRRDFNHDDFFFAYNAWLRAVGAVPFRDFHLNGFTIQSEIAAPLFRLFPESFIPLHAARAVILVAVALLTIVTYRLTKALGAPAPWAAVSIVIVLCQPDVIRRMSDIRTDPVAALFLLSASLAVAALRPERVAVASGVLFGCAIVASFKVILVLPFLAIALLLRSGGRRVASSFAFAGASAIAPVAYYAWRLADDGWDVFIRLWRHVFVQVGSVEANVGGTLLHFLRESPITAVAMVLGFAGHLAVAARTPEGRPGAVYACLALGFIGTTLAVNPFLFPYNFMIIVPVLAPLVSGIRWLIPERQALLEPATLIAISLLALSYAATPLAVVSRRSNERQIALVEWIWRSTTPDERIFDWQGLHFGRRGIYHWWTYTGAQAEYRSGRYSVENELRKYEVSLIIENFRLGFLKPGDAEFVSRHYVHWAPCLFSPGAFFAASRLSTPQRFEIFVPGRYRIVAKQPVSIDGLAAAPAMTLTRGWHTVALASAPTDVAIYYSTGLREASPPPCTGEPVFYGFYR